METVVKELAEMTRSRPLQLKELKAKGKKVVEYTGSFIPEPLIRASGAEPYLMCRGGEPEPPEAVLPYMLRFMNPFARAQAGYYLMGLDPVTPMADLIVAQQSTNHEGRISEVMEYLKLPVYKVGVPVDWDKPFSQEYYCNGLRRLREKLGQVTGTPVTEGSLKEWIVLENKINGALRKIDELRKSDSPPISGYDFIRLNHYTFYCEPQVVVSKLEKVYEMVKDKKPALPAGAPRTLLAGHVVAVGDYIVPRLIEEAGAVIVAEMLDEGMRKFKWDVKVDGDLIGSIARTYYLGRVPPSIFQPAWKQRFEAMKRIIEDYRVDGVVWYQLSFDEIYDMECACIAKWLGEAGVPLLKLESSYEYSRESTGPLRTRIESFVESIRARR